MTERARAEVRRLTVEDVERAREVIRRHLAPTPLRRSYAAGPGVRLKLECWQPTGAFKVRGALNVLASLGPDERRRGVVAASAGNHALGVAFAAESLGGSLPVTLFVPGTAPRAKLDKLRTFPVTVVEAGATYDEAAARAHEHAGATGAFLVEAYDDVRTAAGQGTIGLEILEQDPSVATVVVPVGGGGLIAGIATVLKARRPEIRVVAVQPEASPALRDSLAAGRPLLEYVAGPTLADGLAGGIGHMVFAHRDLIDEVVVVSEAEIEEAMVALVASDQVLAEGSAAAALAAVRGRHARASGGGGTAVILTGGNVDVSVLARLLGRR